MFKWYADDSALKKKHGDNQRSVFLFGGILISRQDEISLSSLMKEIKMNYTGEDMPVKFNLKDLREIYQRFNRLNEYDKLIKDSAVWRKRIIEESLKFNFTVFISCIENFQSYKKDQKTIKQDLASFMFSNALMRVGLYAAQNKMNHIQVVLDWPESNFSKPFDREYYYAYNRGTSSENQRYYCGPLSKLGFDQSIYYTRCNHSNLLQFTDIILGATRDWMDTEFQNREYSIGKDLVKLFQTKFYGYPKKVLKYGINVSSNNESLKSQLKDIIDKMYVS